MSAGESAAARRAAQEAGLSPLLARMDALAEAGGRAIVAIDGMSGSGKTALAERLRAIYGAQVLHMDDFFLQPHQRTKQRLATPGGNVDYERFGGEVLFPLRRGEAFGYRPYDCGTGRIAAGTPMEPAPLTVVEGSYSLHPALCAAYDLTVCLRMDAAAQSARLLQREGAARHARFMREWVPLENLYLDRMEIARRCDLCLWVTPLADGVRFAKEGTP